MNLFIETMAEYLQAEWKEVLAAPGGPREARFIVQSLDPVGTLALFQALDAGAADCSNGLAPRCHFRVAMRLWATWRREAPDAEAAGAITALEQADWIDRVDRLTWYRNRTAADEQAEALVVVLVGLNHATDQGGLTDFHRVDETRLLRHLHNGFAPWLTRLTERLGVAPSETALARCDALLTQLFKLHPLRLAQLAEFLERLINEGPCYEFSEFEARLLRALPFWDLPPLLTDAQGNPPLGKRAPKAVKDADAFINHQGYKTRSGQNKDLDKLKRATEQPDFVLPLGADGAPLFADPADYLDCLTAFIERADPAARARLLQADFLPVFTALNKKEEKPPKPPPVEPKSIQSFPDLSLNALLQGIWDALLRFARTCGNDMPMWAQLAGVQVRLEAFHHDLSADEDAGQGPAEQARELLRGCLGGLPALFAQMELCLPADAAQKDRPADQWPRTVPIDLNLNLNGLLLASVRGGKTPFVRFRVEVTTLGRQTPIDQPYHWELPATAPERVRHACAERVYQAWARAEPPPHRLLPAFRIERVLLAALFYAADADEANRLLAQALDGLTLLDLRDGLPPGPLDRELLQGVDQLAQAYHKWLAASLDAHKGWYAALFEELNPLLNAFETLARLVMESQRLGAEELLRRLYKAFLLVDDQVQVNDPYLPAAVAWGLTPAVLELCQAQARFLTDGFPQAVQELAVSGPDDGKLAFARLLALSRMHRPITALVTDHRGQLDTNSRSFALLHALGRLPDTAKTLAVQTLLKEDESGDEEQVVRTVSRAGEEAPVVHEVLRLYGELHPHAYDGLRILAVHVRELPTILAGVESFLAGVLKPTKPPKGSQPPPATPFYCTVMVWSVSSSPLAMEHRLTQWRDRLAERYRDAGRTLVLTVGHRFAPKARIRELLGAERRRYDLAFLFHFLRTDMDGRVDPAGPFTLGQAGSDGLFPIAEYPRPIKAGDRTLRQMLLSNRRLRVQTRLSDLSARLCRAGPVGDDFLVSGQVDFSPWAAVVAGLHAQAQWVACLDAFVDKRLLSPAPRPGAAPDGLRRIVGFESGLGAYGELNLTISTEQDTLDDLTRRVAGELSGLLPFAQTQDFTTIAGHIVAEAEEIIGLASLRAVLGDGERLREVVGFAAIGRLLPTPPGEMSQLLPLDAFTHWLPIKTGELRPDLLHLRLTTRADGPPLIEATVIECKVANHNPVHEAKALAQVCQGLRRLIARFAPRGQHQGLRRFDRRYWWAQLHRAITSRAELTLSQHASQDLDLALEGLAEGRFEVCWRGLVFTFWTNVAMPVPSITPVPPPEPVTDLPLAPPGGFRIEQVQLGYEGLGALFAGPAAVPLFAPSGPAICLGPRELGGLAPIGPEGRADEPGPVPDPVPAAVAPDPVFAVPGVPVAPDPPPVGTDVDAPRPADGLSTTRAHADPPLEHRDDTPLPPPFTAPERILIGTRTNDEPVYWHFGHPSLANRHLLIFGTSGSGKTYGIQCLLAEMASTGLRSLIVDYTNGFLPSQVEPLFKAVARPKDHFVRTERLPLNPFRRQQQVLDLLLPPVTEGTYQVATRIASIFSAVFNLGEQQSAALIRALQSGLDLDPAFSFERLLPRLREEGKSGESLADKLGPLVNARPFRDGAQSAWEAMLSDPDSLVQVLQLAGLAGDIQKLVTEFVLWDIWDYAQSTGNKDRPIPIVLDEIQNLDHSSDSPIDKMLREGRKFGIALMLATQTTSQFNQEQRDRLFQAGHKLFFKPAATEIDRFAGILAQATKDLSKADWGGRLAALEKGQCWSLGPVLRADGRLREEAVLVRITALEQRRFGQAP